MLRATDKITALYCRLSVEDMKEDKKGGKEDVSNSIQNQKMILLQYAKENRFPNPTFFVDDGYSGTNYDRPGFQAMLAEIEAGRVAVCITKDLCLPVCIGNETCRSVKCQIPFHTGKMLRVSGKNSLQKLKQEQKNKPDTGKSHSTYRIFFPCHLFFSVYTQNLVNQVFARCQNFGKKVFSPLMTFFMYVPSGIAKTTRIARYISNKSNMHCKRSIIINLKILSENCLSRMGTH